jgi:hypothetical protein
MEVFDDDDHGAFRGDMDEKLRERQDPPTVSVFRVARRRRRMGWKESGKPRQEIDEFYRDTRKIACGTVG